MKALFQEPAHHIARVAAVGYLRPFRPPGQQRYRRAHRHADIYIAAGFVGRGAQVHIGAAVGVVYPAGGGGAGGLYGR